MLTEADAKDYREHWPEAPAEILVMRNASSFEVAPDVPPLSSKVVLAAGRLHPVKGFSRLIDAWAPIAPSIPTGRCTSAGSDPTRTSCTSRSATTA